MGLTVAGTFQPALLSPPPLSPQVLTPSRSWGTRPRRAQPAWSLQHPWRAQRRVLTRRGAQGRVQGRCRAQDRAYAVQGGCVLGVALPLAPACP